MRNKQYLPKPVFAAVQKEVENIAKEVNGIKAIVIATVDGFDLFLHRLMIRILNALRQWLVLFRQSVTSLLRKPGLDMAKILLLIRRMVLLSCKM